jgi:YD repeat-containing protein
LKVTYDPDVDVLYILLRDAPIEESDEGKPGVILDYDKAGNIVGIEILDASKRTENPRAVEYAVEKEKVGPAKRKAGR